MGFVASDLICRAHKARSLLFSCLWLWSERSVSQDATKALPIPRPRSAQPGPAGAETISRAAEHVGRRGGRNQGEAPPVADGLAGSGRGRRFTASALALRSCPLGINPCHRIQGARHGADKLPE